MMMRNILAALLLAAAMSGCGSVKEKTAPCKRPGTLTSFIGDDDVCGPMHAVNDPAAVFRAVGIAEPEKIQDGADE